MLARGQCKVCKTPVGVHLRIYPHCMGHRVLPAPTGRVPVGTEAKAPSPPLHLPSSTTTGTVSFFVALLLTCV